jgi:uncharacterized protein (TIGR02611 family)
MAEERSRPFIDRVRERRERHRERNRIIRFVWAIFGFLVVLLGLVMLVTPGPGLLVIAVGLGILALEFAWAERLLERTVDKMEQAGETVREASLWQQALAGVALILGFAAVAVAAYLWDIPLVPV